MLFEITYFGQNATDLGYLLHKNPKNLNRVQTSFGEVLVYYPEISDEKCTASLLLNVDPISLVRGKINSKNNSSTNFSLAQYVNDRPYVASSFLSTAISKTYGTALGGNCKHNQNLAQKKINLEAKISVIPARGGQDSLKELFEPLGYKVDVIHHPMIKKNFGEGHYYTLTIKKKTCLVDLLRHVYILIPVLNNNKHYWVGKDEVDKLLTKGKGWLEEHPNKEKIVSRYLKYRKNLTSTAMAELNQLLNSDNNLEITQNKQDELEIEKKINLHEIRLKKVVDVLCENNISSVVDLGCGEGKLLKLLLNKSNFKKILGMDVSYRCLEIAKKRLYFDTLPEKKKNRIELIQGSLMYRDERLNNFEAACVVEVIEHLDKSRLAAFERVVFEFAKPKLVVITTPNREYNVLFEELQAGEFRHKDHRFEWTRDEFKAWANNICDKYNYNVEFANVGSVDENHGAITQMGIFKKI